MDLARSAHASGIDFIPAIQSDHTNLVSLLEVTERMNSHARLVDPNDVQEGYVVRILRIDATSNINAKLGDGVSIPTQQGINSSK